MSDIAMLVELQETDAGLVRARKELEELPEAQQILECRTKRKAIKAKQDQVVELSDETDSKLARLQAEEEKVIEKINALQAKLDTSSDYRVTKSVTRDLEGQMKRQQSISAEQDELLERQIKIDKLADQVADMIAKVNHKEEHLTADFKEKGGKIKERIDGLQATHDELSEKLDPDVARRYGQLLEEKGGIALARLEADHCSACHTTLPVAQLERLRKGPDLAECPNCQRLLIVREP